MLLVVLFRHFHRIQTFVNVSHMDFFSDTIEQESKKLYRKQDHFLCQVCVFRPVKKDGCSGH